MSDFADTSFLLSLYLWRETSRKANEVRESLQTPLVISPLLRYEFETAVRLLAFRNRSDHRVGVAMEHALVILNSFQLDVERGSIVPVACNHLAILQIASALSEKHVFRTGSRAFDILHVATAIHLGATRFLTFDHAQRVLAAAAGLEVAF